jgi:hypothetical protein
LQELLLAQLCQRGIGTVIAAGIASYFTLSTILNVLKQFLLKTPDEPPVVFHWFPIIGSTITYGRNHTSSSSTVRRRLASAANFDK